MNKFKVGDRVRMKDSYRDWMIANIPELYSVGGKYKPGYESELLALFCSREFGDTLDGTITRIGADDSPNDPAPFWAEYRNQYGFCATFVSGKNLIKLIPKKCKTCGK